MFMSSMLTIATMTPVLKFKFTYVKALTETICYQPHNSLSRMWDNACFSFENLKSSRALSSGSSGRGLEGGKKHEIYAAEFEGHLFYDLLLQDHPPPPGAASGPSVGRVMRVMYGSLC